VCADNDPGVADGYNTTTNGATPQQIMPNDQTFLQEFEAQRWPLDQWHHRDHLKPNKVKTFPSPFRTAPD
jgi:hypothetical protein